MKIKSIITIIIIFFLALTPAMGAKQNSDVINPFVQKTYILKNVSADYILDSLKVYISNYSSNRNILSVTIMKENVKMFEKLLNQLDVKKKRIKFRIFSIIGRHSGQSDKIENKDLKRVLNELKDVLSFKSFKIDGVSYLSSIDGARLTSVSLPSRSGMNLKLKLGRLSLKDEMKGGRSIHFAFELSSGLSSTTYIKENGYLVAGVSRLGKNGDSLILVINAKID